MVAAPDCDIFTRETALGTETQFLLALICIYLRRRNQRRCAYLQLPDSTKPLVAFYYTYTIRPFPSPEVITPGTFVLFLVMLRDHKMNILDLPQELVIHVILQLDPSHVVTCGQVSAVFIHHGTPGFLPNSYGRVS